VPADVCGFTTLESLDVFGSIDDLNFSLDSAVWSTACFKYGDGVVTTNGTASATPSLLLTSNGTIISVANVDASAGLIVSKEGNIDVSASASASPTRVLSFTGTILGDADATSNGYLIVTRSADVDATATATASPTQIISFTGTISGSGDSTANGYLIVTRSGDIDVSANMSSSFIKIISFSGEIEATGNMQGLGGAVFEGFSFMGAQANVYVNANAVFEYVVTINGNVTTEADLYIYGQEWTPVSTGSETWTQIG